MHNSCEHLDIEVVDGSDVCTCCGLYLRPQEYKSEWVEAKVVDYNMNVYVDKQVDKIQGIGIPSNLMESQFIALLLDNLPEEFTWVDVHKYCTSNCMSRHFLYMPYVLGFEIDVDEMYDEIRDIFFKDYFYSQKKSPNLLYIIYKTNQMFGIPCEHIPIYLAPNTIKRYDQCWKRFCMHYDTEYKPTVITVIKKSDLRIYKKYMLYKKERESCTKVVSKETR